MIRAPSSAWQRICRHSLVSRRAGFIRIESGIASLPMSWKSAAWPSRSSSACERSSTRPMASDSSVRGASGPPCRSRVRPRSPTGSPSPRSTARAGDGSPSRANVLRVDRLRGLAELLRAALGVRQVGRLRLAHQQQRQDGDAERRARRPRCRRSRSRRKESEGGVVRQEPHEALAPDAEEALPALDAERGAEQAHVHGVVGERRDHRRWRRRPACRARASRRPRTPRPRRARRG